MSPSSLQVIDCDGHVTETIADFMPFLEPPYDNRMVFERMGISGAVPSSYNWPLAPYFLAAGGDQYPNAVDTTPERYLAFLDSAGIDTSVLIPSAGGLNVGMIKDLDWACALSRAYNSWMHETYLTASPRFKAVAVLPLNDVQEAVKELRRAVTELGMVGALLGGGMSKLLGHPDLWPLYEEAQRLNVPVVSHGGPARAAGWDMDFMGFQSYTEMHTLHQPLNNLLQLNSIVFNGVPEKFPGLRILIAEVGSEWAVYWMDRADEEWELRGSDTGITRKPSDLVRSGRFYFQAAEYERSIPMVSQRIGAGCLVFSSDYPHEKNLEKHIQDITHTLESEDWKDGDLAQKIFCDNGKRLYNLS